MFQSALIALLVGLISSSLATPLEIKNNVAASRGSGPVQVSSVRKTRDVPETTNEPDFVQTSPFILYAESRNNLTNGLQFSALHSGAGIEMLVAGGGKNDYAVNAYTLFNFNISYDATMYPYTETIQMGEVVWTLQGVGFNVSSPLRFSFNPSFDTALLQFEPNNAGTAFYFKDDTLLAQGYAKNGTGPVVSLNRFYVCDTSYAQGGGYTYRSLHWALGSRHPENKNCHKVTVKRSWIYA